MYGKLYESTYTGSMYGGGATLFAVWGYVIANTKPDDLVELNPAMLAAILGVGIETVADAIDKLCSPDPLSRTKKEEGRRLLKRGEYVYYVVNAAKYRGLPNDRERRAYFAEKQREHRERVKVCQTGMSNSVKDSQSVSNTHTQYSDSVQSTPSGESDFEIFWKSYPRKSGKRAALSAWKRARVPLDVALKAIAKQRDSSDWHKDNGRYIPHPATWLNQGRWEDELELAPTDNFKEV